MGSIVLTTLSVFLGMFFVFMGAMKLSPQINREMHREIRRQFVQYAKVFPLTAVLGVKVSAKHYRLVIGWIELIAGLTLAFIPGRIKLLSNAILLVITVGGVYTHCAIGDRFESKSSDCIHTNSSNRISDQRNRAVDCLLIDAHLSFDRHISSATKRTKTSAKNVSTIDHNCRGIQ